ncbi:MAG: cupin domain-containing protein [Proteobacteria bacterium]|nr:cupin domain-containing protein [Pseudomonadota bacterium]MCH8000974.1 cupin domain-containing protein [Pseudomonadota bacterium]MCH9013180.1 cupin domain-containing protein [Pseudomonadota bacterium]
MADSEPGAAFVRQPDEGESFWQPVPANGYAEVRVSKRDSPKIQGFSSGIQVIAPGCHIREHQHGAEQELLFFFEGTGKILVNGVEHPIRPGTTAYLGPWNKHKIVNDSQADLKMLWVLMPGGLEDFFQAIGRPRTPGEPAPAPFPRPENVEEIERATVYAGLDERPSGAE